MQAIIDFFGRLIEGPEAWANETYRKVMMGVFGLVFGYLGILWILACVGGPAIITMTIWVFLPLFTFIYWQHRAGGLAALIEWFRDKDDPKKKSVWRLYLLIVISAITAGSLAIILEQIDGGAQFPTWILALTTIVVICLILPEKTKLDIWLPRIGAVVVTLALFGTVMGGMGKWSAKVYDATGYSVGVTPSKASVAARKAIAENKRLADLGTERCIKDWKEEHMTKKVVREDQIAAAVAKCQEQWAPVSPSSQKEKWGILDSSSLLGMSVWAIIWGHILWFVGAAILAALGWTFWKKKDDATVATATKTTKVVTSSNYVPITWILLLLIAGAAYWGWNALNAPASQQVVKTGLFQPGESKDWVVSINSIFPPIDAMFYGPAGLPLRKHLKLQNQSHIAENVWMRVLTFTGTPEDDVLLQGTCVKKNYCTGDWEFGDSRAGGTFELFVSKELATAVLYYQQGGHSYKGIEFNVVKGP